jgi:NAD(P)-dependent dehydrogenase (short-subunit alcohol dehydrogenase family)
MARFDGKVIVSTGSTQGLGEAILRLLAEGGAAGVVVSGRSKERGERVATELTSDSCRAIFVATELSEVESCRELIQAADSEFGRIDGLVNAAANTERGTLEDTSPEHWDKIMATNLRAPFFLMQHAVKVMQRDGRGGSIVNIQSMSAHGGTPNLTPYSVSKGGLAVLTKNAAHSQREHRIRVNALNIGWMATPAEHAVQMSEGQPDNWLEIGDARMPFGRILRPKDVANMTAYLLSDESEMMTGSVVDFDQHVMGIYNP